jgi:hypothetical protein
MLKVYEENEEMQKERTYLDQTNIQRHKKMQELHKISAEQKVKKAEQKIVDQQFLGRQLFNHLIKRALIRSPLSSQFI